MKNNTYFSTISIFIMWIMFILLGIISKFISAEHKINDIYSIIIISILSIFALTAIFANTNTKLQKIIVYLGYCAALFLLFYDRIISSFDTTDPDGFHKAALMKANNDYSLNYGGIYTDIIAVIYKLYGGQRIIGQFFNLLLIITIEVICIKIFDNLEIDEKNKTIGITMLALSPNYLFVNCTLRREAIIEFLLSISLYYFVEWYKKHSIIHFTNAVLFSLLASLFHSGSIAAAIGYILFYILYVEEENNIKFTFKKIFAVFLLVTLAFILNYYLGNTIFSKFQISDLNDYMMRIENGNGGAGYSLQTVTTGNMILDLIINTPLRIVYYILSPMPWQWRGLKDIIAFLFSSLYYFIGIIYAVCLIRDKEIPKNNKNLIIALFITMCVSCVVFSWGVRNSGTALRHRDKFISIYIAMLILCLKQRKINKEEY